MTTTVIHCDRCRAQIETDRSKLEVVVGPALRALPPAVETGRVSIDLCLVCAGDLANWLAANTQSPKLEDLL